MNRLAFAALALVAAFGLGWWQGAKWQANKNAALVLKIQQEKIEQAEKTAEEERKRLLIEAERKRLAQQLEDAANAQPVDPNCGLGVDRVRRLNLR